MVIQQNDILNEEFDTQGLFNIGNYNEIDVTNADIVEKNSILNE